MLEVRELHTFFGDRHALRGITLEVPPGQMVGVLGRSGAGKSTLLRALNRLTEPSRGEIRFQGQDVRRFRGRALREWRRRCAMIFQQFQLVSRLDVLTNVLLGCAARKMTPAMLLKWFTAQERARALLTLERVGLAEHALQRADRLSGGQQQRVAIARALMQEPDLVLADEPVSSLDPYNARKVMGILRCINVEEGVTVVASIHVPELAKEYCDRVVGLVDGAVAFDGDPAALTSEVLAEIYGWEQEEGETGRDDHHTSPMWGGWAS